MVAFYNQGDQNIYKDFQYVPQEKYRLGFTAPVKGGGQDASTPSFGIPNTNAFTNSSGDNNYFSGSTNSLIQDYNTTTKDRYFRNQDTPLVDDLYQSKLDKNFMGMPSYRQQDFVGPFTPYGQPMNMDDPAASIENIIASRNMPLEQTTAGRIQGIGSAFGNKARGVLDKFKGFGPVSMALNSMDKFSSLSPTDQQFINMNMGYTGPTIFGENSSGLPKDIYGINTRSLFGNYSDFVENYDTNYTEKQIAAMSKTKQQRINFYKQQKIKRKEIERKQIQKQRAESAENRGEANAITNRLANEYKDKQNRDGRNFDVSGPDTSANPTGKSNQASSERGYALHGADGGRAIFKYGGLTSIL